MGENSRLDWLAMPDLPNSLGVAGPFVGVSYRRKLLDCRVSCMSQITGCSMIFYNTPLCDRNISIHIPQQITTGPPGCGPRCWRRKLPSWCAMAPAS